MLLGSIYDWVMALLIFLYPKAITFFGVPFPTDLMYFRWGGLLMLILPFFYLLAYINTEKNIAVVPSAILARTAGFLFLTLHTVLLGEAPVWVMFGLADLLFGVLHYIYFKRCGYAFINALK